MRILHRQVCTVLFLCLFQLTVVNQAKAADFVIADNGQAAASIVIADPPSKSAQFAAAELREHIRKITGATLPVVTDQKLVSGPRILIGESAATKALGVGADRLKSQEYLIRFLPDTLVLMGKDRELIGGAAISAPLRIPFKVGGFDGTLPELYDDNGTLYAVYDFLERFCEVRWYAPTELGTVCPKKPTLAVHGSDIRRTPLIIHRRIDTPLYLMPGRTDQWIPQSDVHLWKLRMRLGGQPFMVVHSFSGYYDRFLKDHPDWFAQGYDGQPQQMCFTNPGLIQQVVQDARDYFDGKGLKPGGFAQGDVFAVVPADGNFWCKCSRCQAAMNLAEQSNPQFNNGKASDYIFGFVNQVAREVRQTHPDKWIGALAYCDYAYYPEKVNLEPNVIVQMCLHTRNWWSPAMEKNDRKVLADWRRHGPDRPLYLWLYYCFPAFAAQTRDFHCFPGLFAHTVAKQMKTFAKADIRGIFLEATYGNSYLMDHLECYLTMKLADDSALDGNQLIDDFFACYYGAAARPMRDLYGRIEDTYSNPKYYPPEIRNSAATEHQDEKLAWNFLGTEERMAEFSKLMQEAVDSARTPEEKQRVAHFKQGLWDYMVEGKKMYLARAERYARPLPHIQVPQLASEAGGDLSKVDWSQAKDLGAWSTLSGDATDRKVEARVAYDSKHLYVQLTEWLDPAKLVSSATIWDGEDWEALFAVGRKKASRQLCIAPNGKYVAMGYETYKQEKPEKWDSGAVVLSDTSGRDRWVVRLALPFDKAFPDGLKDGTTFYVNFYRTSPMFTRLLAWSPNFGGGFNDTSRLGKLTLAP